MNENLEKFYAFSERMAAFNAAYALLGWDDETLAPKGAREMTAHLESVLYGEMYALETDPEYRAAVFALSEDETISDAEKEFVRKSKKAILDAEVVPKEVLQAYEELTMKSWSRWEECKAAKDFKSYAPVLHEVIEATKQIAEYRNRENKKLYDVLLTEYEDDFDSEVLDRFFSLLRKEIVPLLKNCEARNHEIRTDFLRRKYDIDKQKEFNRFLAEYVGFDFDRGVIAEYQHPFTTNLHMNDVRITTSYIENAPESAMFSTVHEASHALFEQDQNPAYAYVPAAWFSMGIHESQSRLYENMIGRSRAFWEPIYGRLQETFPECLSDVTLTEWVKAINKPESSLIRTEADELTYCLHIMVRYEIEKKIFNGGQETETLSDLWNDMMKEYLGVTVGNDAEGILQDVHWSQGSFGYFPSYAIGNAIAAQLYHTMDREIGVERCLSEGRPEAVHEWLRKNVHEKAGAMKIQTLLQSVTGEPFNPVYYVEYLKEKFTKLYE